MGAGLKSCRVTDEGIYAKSDWSHYNQAEILMDRNFWRQFSMLFLSATFFYFMKLASTSPSRNSIWTLAVIASWTS